MTPPASLTRHAAQLATLALACAPGAAQPGPARVEPGGPLVIRAALAHVAPTLVRIDTIGGATPVQRERDHPDAPVRAGIRQGQGPTTGVVCSSDGFILTSSFNFVRNPSVITVTLHDGRKSLARLVARDRLAGLTLLKVDAGDLPVPEWLPLRDVHPGQRAIGAGFGLGTAAPALSVGIISATRRLGGVAVQSDARVSPAHFGGPLFDIHGRLFGVLVPYVDPDQEFDNIEWYDSGITFAVHGDYVARRIDQLKAGRDVERGRIGAVLAPSEAPPGMRVDAAPLGPAAAAGLRRGDVLVEVCGQAVTAQADVRRALGGMAAGDTARVAYVRDGVRAELDLVLAPGDALGPTSQPAGAKTR